MENKRFAKARYYSYALFELAQEKDSTDTILSELELVDELQHQIPKLKKFFELSLFTKNDKYQLLDKISPLSSLVLNLLKILVRKKQFFLFDRILFFYRNLTDENAKRARATATTVVPLKTEQLANLATIIEEYIGQKALVTNKIDAKIIGGLTLQVNDLWIDASLKGNLARLHKQFSAVTQQHNDAGLQSRQ